MVIMNKQIDLKPLKEDEDYIYKDEIGNLYVYEPKTGGIWTLTPANFIGNHGPPLPEIIEGIGKMTLLGAFKLSY